MAKILITGGSGLVGKAISELLLINNHTPVWLGREDSEWKGIRKYRWDPETRYLNERALEDVETVICLAGAPIADKRWTPKYKQKILDSRVKANELLLKAIVRNRFPVKTLIGASAVGYYGARQSDRIMTESDQPHDDFLAQTCIAWENSYKPFVKEGITTSVIRTALVLSKHGGAYPRLTRLFKAGLGAAIGSGKQYMPWVHIDDIAGMYYHLLKFPSNQIYNGAASEQVSNLAFTQSLALSLGKKVVLPNVPEWLLKIGMGESYVLLTEGMMVSNDKIKDAGYNFKFDRLEDALRDLAS